MQHADFVNDLNGHRCNWHLTNWTVAVRTALGSHPLFRFRCAFAVVLAPAVVLAGYSFYSGRPLLLVMAGLSFWGFWTSSTGPTGIGMTAYGLLGLLGFGWSVAVDDWMVLISTVLPGLTWFASCALLGVTASYLVDALARSESSFQLLYENGTLVRTGLKQEPVDAKSAAAAASPKE